MSADPAIRRATYADLEAVPPHLVAEIVDGVLETHPRGAPLVGASLGALSGLLLRACDIGRTGPNAWSFLPRPELHLDNQVVVPDLAGWRRERFQIDPEAVAVRTVPDWICEILSPSRERLDRCRKRRIYAETGVGHLWLLDPKAKLLEAFALVGGQWVLLATIEPGEEVRVAPFDAVGFPLDALFPFDEPLQQKPSEEA